MTPAELDSLLDAHVGVLTGRGASEEEKQGLSVSTNPAADIAALAGMSF